MGLIGELDPGVALVAAAAVAAVPATIAAVVGLRSGKRAREAKTTASETRTEVMQAIDTGNGHTLGQAVARLEEMGWRHENRIDKLDYKLDLLGRHWSKHDEDMRPLAEWVRQEMRKSEGDGS